MSRLDHEAARDRAPRGASSPNDRGGGVTPPPPARQFEPGQFYRLQNFEALARRVDAAGRPTPLLMEGIASPGRGSIARARAAVADRARARVSSRLCAYLKPGEAGRGDGADGRTDGDSAHERVLLAGGAWGTPSCFLDREGTRGPGNQVIYFAG